MDLEKQFTDYHVSEFNDYFKVLCSKEDKKMKDIEQAYLEMYGEGGILEEEDESYLDINNWKCANKHS